MKEITEDTFRWCGVEVRYTFREGHPGSTGGPPDTWAPPEGAEVEIIDAHIVDLEEFADYSDTSDVWEWIAQNDNIYDAIIAHEEKKAEAEHPNNTW